MKTITHLKALIFILFIAFMFMPETAFADRCDPKMLEKLPPKKRASIEKNCEEKAKKSAYVISNLKTINSEPRPEDKYNGDDKDKLEQMIRTSWMKEYPNDKIMGIHFSVADWKRTKNKRWNSAINTWQYTDVSVLPAKVVVKTDDKLATIFVAYINKDNMDESINTGVATKKREYVINQMLISNY